MRGFCPSYFFGGIMDIIKKWFLRIDIEREFDTPIIELYMQDVKTNLFITTLTNNGARISLKDYNIVTLNVLKADDTKLMVSGKVTEDGNAIFEMDSQATSVKGICSATIRIYEGDSSVTSKPFYFSVIDDPYRGTDNSIVSQNSYTALQNILSQTAKALEEAVKVNDYFKVNLPTVKELISYEPILRDIVKNKDEAKELIRETKNLQVKIDASMADLKRLEGLIPEVNRLVDKGNETIRVLTNATENVSEIIARADVKKSELEKIIAMFKDIDERAQKLKLISDEINSLLPKLDEARGMNSSLKSTITSAKSNKTDLEKTITSAGDINGDLGNKISQSKTLSNNLEADIEDAKTTNFTLNSDRESAKLIVTELKNAKNDADVINSELNSTKIKADSSKAELEGLIANSNSASTEARALNKSLGETNTKAESNKLNLDRANTKAESLKEDLVANTSLAEGINAKLKTNTDLAITSNRELESNKDLADDSLNKLKDFIQQSSNLETSINKIIANGDLSKYITEPKLQEVLEDYVKKQDIKGFIDKYVKEESIKIKTMTAVIDQSNSNPLTCVTYEDDARMMEKGSSEWDDFFGTKLVLFKDGKEVRDLQDSELNSVKPEDGDVMVKFKRMGLNIKTIGDKVYISMTNDPDDDNFKYYAHTRGTERREAFYLGAYLGFLDGNKLRSLTGKKPQDNKSLNDFRTYAQANGSGYDLCGFYQLTFLQAIYLLKYGNLDSQTAIGTGLTSGGQNVANTTGATNGQGIDYGTANSAKQMRFQFLEDFCGNRHWAIDGIATDPQCVIYIAKDNFNSTRDGYTNTGVVGSNVEGWINKAYGTTELGFLSKEYTGSSTTFYTDYGTVKANYCLFFGGFSYSGAQSGAFTFYLYLNPSETIWSLSARLMYL